MLCSACLSSPSVTPGAMMYILFDIFICCFKFIVVRHLFFLWFFKLVLISSNKFSSISIFICFNLKHNFFSARVLSLASRMHPPCCSNPRVLNCVEMQTHSECATCHHDNIRHDNCTPRRRDRLFEALRLGAPTSQDFVSSI